MASHSSKGAAPQHQQDSKFHPRDLFYDIEASSWSDVPCFRSYELATEVPLVSVESFRGVRGSGLLIGDWDWVLDGRSSV